MELRTRVENLLQPPVPVGVPVPTRGSSIIVSLEEDVSKHFWLRGIMCFLFILSFCLSIFKLDSFVGNTVIHVLLLLLSLGAEVCLYFIYHIKARFAGFTNPANTQEKKTNVFHSPLLGSMIFEMVLWLLQCPPGVSNLNVMAGLDSLILLRVYVVIIFLTKLGTRSIYKRVIAHLCGFRYNSSYLWQSQLFTQSPIYPALGFLMGWLAVSLLHAKGEDTSYLDSLYFSFTTAAFQGYGDYSPRSFVGRLAAVLSWTLGVGALAYCVTLMHQLLKISEPERNLYTLFHVNQLCSRVPGEAARVIQRSWKLYVVKRDGRNALSIQFNAFFLSTQCANFRRLRREFKRHEEAFIRSSTTFEDAIAALSAYNSRATTPSGSRATTPRRRPFALYQDTKAKPATPRETALNEDPSHGKRGATKPLSRSASFLSASALGAAGNSHSHRTSKAITEACDKINDLNRTLDALLLRTRKLTNGLSDHPLSTPDASTEVDS
ncbi:Ion channel, putative [Angomonas deanei]|uniref:Ion channel, putative n=1 Tax=Angomonas deanei TaxID=59799 RepID=A0A7G2CIT0_9TRYP|nr:Ion channel, putative [Angomonas deanei]